MSLTTGLIDALPAHGVAVKLDDRAAWLAARHQRIGGSTLPCLYGYGYKKSLLEFWDEKSNDLPPLAKKETGPMKRGRKMEPVILEELAERTGWEVEHWPQNWILDHPSIAGYGVTLDGIAVPTQENFPFPLDRGETVVAQVKTANEFAKARWPRNDDNGFLMLPPHQIQLQAEMDCAGVRYGVLAVQVGMDFDDLFWICVARDDDFIETVHADIPAFWESIANGDRPDVDGSQATYDYLRRQFKETDGSACELPGDSDLWLAEWAEGTALRKAGEAKETHAKSKIMAAMQDATYARTPNGRPITYKEQSQTRIDAGKLRAKYPEAAEECEKTSFFRVLREAAKLPPEALAMLDG